MKKVVKSAKATTAEEIARMAERGECISGFFTGEGQMVQPIQRVNVDEAAQDLNVSRQAVIKTLMRQALD